MVQCRGRGALLLAETSHHHQQVRFRHHGHAAVAVWTLKYCKSSVWLQLFLYKNAGEDTWRVRVVLTTREISSREVFATSGYDRCVRSRLK